MKKKLRMQYICDKCDRKIKTNSKKQVKCKICRGIMSRVKPKDSVKKKDKTKPTIGENKDARPGTIRKGEDGTLFLKIRSDEALELEAYPQKTPDGSLGGYLFGNINSEVQNPHKEEEKPFKKISKFIRT